MKSLSSYKILIVSIPFGDAIASKKRKSAILRLTSLHWLLLTPLHARALPKSATQPRMPNPNHLGVIYVQLLTNSNGINKTHIDWQAANIAQQTLKAVGKQKPQIQRNK